jgi:hypothetical protein
MQAVRFGGAFIGEIHSLPRVCMQYYDIFDMHIAVRLYAPTSSMSACYCLRDERQR